MGSSSDVMNFSGVPENRAPLSVAEWSDNSDRGRGRGDLSRRSREPRPYLRELRDEDACFALAASLALGKIRAQVECVAAVDFPVLVLGERGVGKGSFARLIHRLSSRSYRTFQTVNCAALPGSMLESELFGSEAGDGVGPLSPQPGKLRRCNKGTLLLEEIGELPPSLWGKLWQALEDRQFSRRDGRAPIAVDVRVLATMSVIGEHRNLSRCNRDGAPVFRDDRLRALTILLPALRDRRDEIPCLLEHFMEEVALQLGRAPKPVSPRVVDACLGHNWPGNLREFKSFVIRYLTFDNADEALQKLSAPPARPRARGICLGMRSKIFREHLRTLAGAKGIHGKALRPRQGPNFNPPQSPTSYT